MGIMFQSFRPGRGVSARARYLLEKWSKLTNQKKETIIKEVLGDNSPNGQRGSHIKDALTKAINNTSSDQR